jgi:hypothetical protein
MANDIIDDDIGDVSELINNPPSGGIIERHGPRSRSTGARSRL